jgi:hypothetical protein
MLFNDRDLITGSSGNETKPMNRPTFFILKREIQGITNRLLSFRCNFTNFTDTISRKKTLVCMHNEINKTI